MSMIDKKIGEFKTWAFKNGDDFFEITDKDLLGKWNVLCFYPGDFTFVCPTELEDLQQQYEQLKKLGVEVYSVSTDSHFTHKAWHDTSNSVKKITYTMIGDITHEMTKSFDVYTEATGQAQRATFIIDPDGIIKAIEINSNGIGRDASILVNKVKAAQYIRKNPAEVCPAKWQEGEETITPSLDLIGKI